MVVSLALVRTAIRHHGGGPGGPPRIRAKLAAGAIALALWGATASSALAAGATTYQVQQGDTLWSIAQRFGVSVPHLVSLNGLANPNFVMAGQILHLESVQSGPSPLIQAPYYRQFDGSIYAESNCGPTALAMALGAIGINAQPIPLRLLAAQQMGFNNPADGTTWESLVYAAQQNGASVEGLYNGSKYRIWSTDDLRAQFAAGHPVILLVRYRSLPDHQGSSYWGDHYIVGLGFDQNGNLVYNDPAFHVGSGADRKISPSQLDQAWSHTAIGYIRTAMALTK